MVNIPLEFREVTTRDESELRKIVEENNGKVILISDFYYSMSENEYFLSLVDYNSHDDECFFVNRLTKNNVIEIPKIGERMRLHYSNIQGLMIPF